MQQITTNGNNSIPLPGSREIASIRVAQSCGCGYPKLYVRYKGDTQYVPLKINNAPSVPGLNNRYVDVFSNQAVNGVKSFGDYIKVSSSYIKGGTTQVFGDTKGGGLFNVLIGTSAGNAMTGQKNIMIGDYTCLRATAINNTVAIGVQSGPLTDYQGDNNFFLGYKAGYNMTGGSRNIHIGQGSGITGTYNDRLFIGNPGEPTNLESAHIITGYFNTGVLRFPKGYANSDTNKFLTTGSDGTLVLSDIKSVIPVPTVNDGKLTLRTSGIATGSGSFTANQATSGSFTVNVPGTDITATLNESKVLNISSSTGTGGSVNLSSLIPTNYVPIARTIIAGDGLSGGGDLSADRTIALGAPGSITAASANSVTATSHTHELAANSIVTTKIANSAVTFAKLQHIPAQTLMGRYATGTGVVQPVTLGTGLSLNASGVLSATNTSSGTVTSVGASTGGNAINVSGSPVTSSGTLVFGFQGTENQYINGIGNLVTFPTIPSGTVTSVTIGNGLTGASPITSAGTITLGTPGTITLSSNNSVTANSHSHAFSPGGTVNQYVSGAGTLITFPTIPTPTRLRGTDTGTYTAGDLSLLGGTGIAISQSGANFTIVNTAPHVPYVLPAATASTLGGIKVGARLSIASGVLSADNMIQSLSLAGQTLSIIGGNSVTLPVANNGILTLKATGIATGGTAAFSANQANDAAWTVNVPGTNLSAEFNTATHILNIGSSTGNAAGPIDLSSLYGGELIRQTASTGYGWRLKDSDDLGSKVELGQWAVDLSYEDIENDPGVDYGPTGQGAFAQGRWQRVSGTDSVAFNNQNTVSGADAAAFGLTNTVSGNGGFSVGWGNRATADWTAAFGHASQANAHFSFAAGLYVQADSYAETAFGNWNTLVTPNSTTGMNNNDRVFSIGNGTSNANRKTAFEILKSGKTTITDLSGTGSRMVIADPSGALSTQAISIDGVTSVTIGNGLSGASPITATGTITLGTPSAITATSTNSVTATSHTHALANGAVTYAKFQSVPTGTLLGRGATGTGVVSAITLGTGLSLSTAGVLSATNTNSGTVTSVAASIGGNAINVSGSPITSSGTLAFAFQGTAAQYINGSGNLATFPAIPTVNNGKLTLTAGAGLTGSATFTANQSGSSTFTVGLNASLDNLNDVISSSPASGQLLRFDGTNWVNWTPNYTANTGTVTGVSAGNGMNFTTISGSGAVTMGMPSVITLSSTNSVTANSHSHAFTPGGTVAQYIRGNGTLATFPTIPTVNNGKLTLATGGIATGSATFTANQSDGSAFTVNVPGTNISVDGTDFGRINSSTGTGTNLKTLGTYIKDNANSTTYDAGLEVFVVSNGTNFAASYGTGMKINRSNDSLGSFEFFASNSTDEKLYFRTGTGGNAYNPWKTIAFTDDILPTNLSTSNSNSGFIASSTGTDTRLFLLKTIDVRTSEMVGTDGSQSFMPTPAGLPGTSMSGLFSYGNTPLGNDWSAILTMKGWTGAYGAWQLAGYAGNGGYNKRLYFRDGANTNWGAWKTVAFLDDINAYTAGNGLTLTGTAFSLPITVSGSGNYVSNVVQNANGITVSKATLPTIGNGILTIQQNGSTVGTFRANQSGNTTINLAGGSGSNEIDDNGYKYGSSTEFDLGWDTRGGFAANATIVSDPTYDVAENDYTVYCIAPCMVTLPDPNEYPNRMLRIVGGLGDNTMVRFNDILPINYLNGTINQIISTSILIQAIVKGDLTGWYLVGGSL